MNSTEILDFWYSERISQQWFNSTPELDQEIKERFEEVWIAAATGKLDDWKHSPEGSLALAIVLDQFPLNMYRGDAKSFSTEQQAVHIAKRAITRGLDKQLPKERVSFLYMPLMHSESLEDQALSVASFDAMGLKNNLDFAKHHQGLIQRFGRFPHRNSILGRESSAEELAYLESDEAFTG